MDKVTFESIVWFKAITYNNNNTRLLTAIFQDNLVSWYPNVTILDFIGAKVMEVVVTTGAWDVHSSRQMLNGFPFLVYFLFLFWVVR